MFLVLGSLLDPAGDEFLVLFRKRFVEIRRGHDVLLVRGHDALPYGTLLRVARDDGVLGPIALKGRVGALNRVEPEVFLALRGVEAVAGKTLVGEDRPDVGVEGNLLREGAVIRLA